LILAKDLGYGEIGKLSAMLEEVSRLLGAYAVAILTCDSFHPAGGPLPSFSSHRP
jgi:hypothetical protein